MDQNLLSDLFYFLNEQEKSHHFELLDTLNNRIARERDVLQTVNYHLDDPVALLPPPLAEHEEASDSTPTRLFFSHLGWHDYSHRTRVFSCKDLTSMDTGSLFKDLDQLNGLVTTPSLQLT